MELAAPYDAPLAGLRWQVFGGPAGEPALGPVAFPHRLSAMPNPVAPLSHHWLDATHIAFGVVTGGVYGPLEGRGVGVQRARTGRGAHRSRLRGARFVVGRLYVLPTQRGPAGVGRWVDRGRSGRARRPARDVTRARRRPPSTRRARRRLWATTVAWGRNVEEGHASNAFLVESALTFRDRDTWFGRFEATGKTSTTSIAARRRAFTVAKLQGGYTRSSRARLGAGHRRRAVGRHRARVI